MKYFHIIFIFLPSLFFGQSAFSDVTLNSGIDNIYDVYEGLFGGGVVAFDYNNDGFEDLYITGGKSQDILYRNNGDGTFKDVINRENEPITDALDAKITLKVVLSILESAKSEKMIVI